MTLVNDVVYSNDPEFEEDGDWMDGDALASVGWGTDED